MSIDQKIAQLLEDSEKLQAEIQEEETSEETLSEATVGSIAKAHGFVKKGGSYHHPETGESIAPLAGGREFGHSSKSGATIAAFKSKDTLEKHLSAKGYKKSIKEDTVEDDEVEVEELKIDVSADVAALVNGEELTEEFKTKAATIFEAAVVTRVKAELAKLEEQFESRLDEQVEEIKNGLVEKVDGYLNYVVEQWMTDNEIALENGLKNDIMESFIVGMKDLFEQHYIDVPQEKYDLIGNMQEEIEGMKSKLDEQLAANVEMKSKLDDMVRKSAIEEVASEMVATDAEKFRGLAEELSFDELESFKSKLQTIKENYFGQKPAAATVDSVVTDSPVQQLDEDVKQIDPIMARYVSALKKS